MLAGLVQTPANDDPIQNPEAALERRNQVLTRMHELGHVTDAELAEITPQPVAVVPTEPPPNGCANAIIAGFFCDYVQRYLTQVLGVPQAQLESGGLTVRPPCAPTSRRPADRSVTADLPLDHPLAAMFTAVEPGTGHVLAMSVNRVFGPDRTTPPRSRSTSTSRRARARDPPTRCSSRPRRTGAGHPGVAHDHHQRPVRLPRLQERSRPLRRAERGPASPRR